MKKIFIGMLSASVCVAAGLAGCTPDGKADNPNFQGEPTSVDLVLRLTPNASTGGQTRATSDPNGTDAEAAPHTFDVFIYTGAGEYLDHKTFTADQFAQGAATTSADVWTANAPISTTTGAKNFLVGVNLPTAAASSLERETMSAAYNITQTIERADITTAVPAGGIPMFSKAPVAVTLVAEPASNKFTAEVVRIVAKVTVEKSVDPVMEQAGVDGTLGQMLWTINNQNTKYFLIQGQPSTYVDPNWSLSQYAASDYPDAATAPVNDAEWKNVQDGPQTKDNYLSMYALENTANEKVQKQLTRVTVRATFIPEEWVATGGFDTNTKVLTRSANGTATPVTFYTVTPSAGEGTEYFQSQADAQSYATYKNTGPSQPVTYTDGWCYWNIFLNKANRGDVYRNDIYRCKITRVVAPGNNSPAMTDPNAQAQTETSITADVDIMFWNAPVTDNYELVP